MTDSKYSAPVALLYAVSTVLCFGVMTVSLLFFLVDFDWVADQPLSDVGAYCLIALAISSGSLVRAASGLWQRSH